MFGIKYDTWESVCNMYFSLSSGSLKSYLQWFPFTILKNADKEIIKSEEFYEKYINTSSFALFPFAMYQSENFLQKGDGSFRDSSLISPLPYLILQSVGKEVYEQYTKLGLMTFQFIMQEITNICVQNTNKIMMIFSRN